MRSRVEFDTNYPGKFKQVVGLSLESRKQVNYNLSTKENSLIVNITTEGIGVLRGCTDTVFRLTTLTKRLYSR